MELLLRCYLIIAVTLATVAQDESTIEYGVDISFPMHHASVSTNYPWLPHNVDKSKPTPNQYQGMPIQPLGNKQAAFEDYMQGCVDYYNKNANGKGDRCTWNEADRIEMSLRQPQSMRNYTTLGYAKIKAPAHVFSLIKTFWEANKDRKKPEQWPVGNIYTNHWVSPTYMVSVEDTSLEGGGYVLKQHIWNAARSTISMWTNQQLAECSLYGIRVYTENSILSPHVDRLPLVSSAIINVDQDVDEDWPIEVIGHDGKAVNITMEPGDMVLYESHSVIHGRPFPLKGRYYANVFIHFEPIGPIGGQVQVTGDLPPCIIPGSPEEMNWRKSHPSGHQILNQRSFATGTTEAHRYAGVGDAEQLRKLLDRNPQLVDARDDNGWTSLHEAVRLGDENVIKLLLDRGADVNARSGVDGEGGSVIWWAKQYHDESHPMFKLLKDRNGMEFEPEL